MTKRVLSVLLVTAGLVLLVGCGGEAPTAELQAVKQILDDARAAGAEKFAPSEFVAAETAYQQAEEAVNTEKEKLFKDFDQPRELIADARNKAEAARAATMTAKQRALEEANSAIAAAADAVETARAHLEDAPSGKGTESDIERLGADLDEAQAELDEARQAVTREDFDAVSTMAASATQTAQQVENGVQMAVERYEELAKRAKPWYEKI